ncbi:MAG: phage tail tube protein [Fermentimonas sp.]
MTDAKSGCGTRLLINNVVVGEVYGVGEISLDRDQLDATSSDSIGCSREYIPGLKNGTFSVTGNWIGDTGQEDVEDAYTGGTTDTYEIAFPNALGKSYEFQANDSDFSISSPHDGIITFDASFQVTGPGTFNDTASAGLTTPYFAITGDSSGAITPTPAASGSTYEYRANADTTDTSITITPTAAAGTIYVNGVTVASGVASGSISIGSTGTYKNIFIEVKESSKAPKIYLIEIYRP